MTLLRYLQVALHQIKLLPGQSSRYTVKFIRSERNEGCDWCIYVTVVTCADTLTSTLCIQYLLLSGELLLHSDTWGGCKYYN